VIPDGNQNNLPIVEIAALGKVYNIYNKPTDRLKSLLFSKQVTHKEFIALQNINVTLQKGDALGIVGRNGSGKSTLLQIMAGTVTPSSGYCRVNGKISALLELGAGFNPEFTGRENIYLNGSILGIPKHEIDNKIDEIIDFSGIGEFVNRPVKTYSSGMFVRLAFSVAISVEPDILIIDEALAVGDELFQKKCYGRIEEFRKNGGTLIFVSHSGSTVIELCNKAILLDSGEMLMDDSPKIVLEAYHRLIYSAPEAQESLRAELKNRGQNKVSTPAPVIPAFDASFIPETMEVYEKNGAVISNPRITDFKGNQTNILTQNQTYIYAYEVEFEEDAENVDFGTMIKAGTGLQIGGVGTAGFDRRLSHVAKGDKFSITMKFKCIMMPGSYFFNCGIVAFKNGAYTFLHRITDAVAIKVIADPDSHATGIIDFGIVTEARKHNPARL